MFHESFSVCRMQDGDFNSIERLSPPTNAHISVYTELNKIEKIFESELQKEQYQNNHLSEYKKNMRRI